MRAQGHSVWLMPSGDPQVRLNRRIAALSERLDTRSFPAHVTVAGQLDLDLDALSEKLRAIARVHNRLALTLLADEALGRASGEVPPCRLVLSDHLPWGPAHGQIFPLTVASAGLGLGPASSSPHGSLVPHGSARGLATRLHQDPTRSISSSAAARVVPVGSFNPVLRGH